MTDPPPLQNELRYWPDGTLYFGVTGDRDHVADIETLTDGIETGLVALLERAAAAGA